MDCDEGNIGGINGDGDGMQGEGEIEGNWGNGDTEQGGEIEQGEEIALGGEIEQGEEIALGGEIEMGRGGGGGGGGGIDGGSDGTEDDSDSHGKCSNCQQCNFAQNVRCSSQWIIIDCSSLMVFFATSWTRRTVMASSTCNPIKSTWITIQ